MKPSLFVLTFAGKLNLVDLAGSERIAKSGAEGSRLREAQCINKSLSALGDVINALRSKHSHVPFRNSRLTYLLQDSLSGDSKTLMMVQVCERSLGQQGYNGERLTLNLDTFWVDYNGFRDKDCTWYNTSRPGILSSLCTRSPIVLC